ncbi:accessory gland protein Acp29AB [Drosophila erecta]|uniref:C-type lectin domain-containing protein n=1 Tax=Drosophila erecta TaxID=7220 RepID=B3N7Y2_DROER|nr:accessory gland protein Acp29AB [Drosophila erecta]EDV58343.2 uncharacterized protein Dere_GG24034 [Drosophila erecta]
MFKYHLVTVILAWTSWVAFAKNTDTQQSQSVRTNPLLVDHVAINQQQWFTYNALKESEIQQKLEIFERTIEGRLMVLQNKLRYELNELQTIIGNKSKEVVAIPRISPWIDPDKFQEIGTRRFYFERHKKQNWFGASLTCRKLGGHLATIHDEKELNDVFSRAPASAYWIDINSLYKFGQLTSTLTGREPPFLKWNTEKKIGGDRCVTVYARKMYTEDCFSKYMFVCQTEQWVDANE